MDAERWKRVKDIFAGAAEKSGPEREIYLENACAGDPDLQREIETLLRSTGGDFLSVPALRLTDEEPENSVPAGRSIGPYQVIRQLGSGGMGSVYLAARADDVYLKNVAIKLVRAGTDSAFVVPRFRNERQILAALEHPNIARLLDGGSTEDGCPYFVMEYVEGKPIDAFCEDCACSVTERIALFLEVCSAVQYAHQHLVIHRDLKPGNILVSADGVPKLLDFGISKLLAPAPDQTLDLTVSAQRLMTPGYASPEQVRGGPITTASDIYSLGVLLYELLTGHRPYRRATRSLGELERAICEDEPLRPSTVVVRSFEDTRGDAPRIIPPEEISRTREGKPGKLRKRLAGDLDTILLMALRKEPSRRYASVEQFADDLRRHLVHLPVRARKDTIGYRTIKFLRRNRAASAAAGLFLLSLIGGMAGTSWQAHIAVAERARAERRFNDVRQLANSFLFEFHDAIQALPGSTAARALVVRRALQYLDSLSREAGGDTALRRELAAAYQKVGDVQGNPSLANLGDTAGALRSQRAALAIRESLPSGAVADPQVRRELSTSHDRVGDLLWMTGDRAGALSEYRKALAVRDRLWSETPDAANAHFLSMTCNNIGDILTELQDPQGALAFYQRGLAIAERAQTMNPTDARASRDLSVSCNRIGDTLWGAGRLPEALSQYQKALAIRQSLAFRDPSNAIFRRDVMSNLNNIGDTLIRMGRSGEALSSYRGSLEIAETLAGADPQNVQARRDLAIAHRNIGAALLESGYSGRASGELRQSLFVFEFLAGRDPTSAVAKRDVAETRELIGKARR